MKFFKKNSTKTKNKRVPPGDGQESQEQTKHDAVSIPLQDVFGLNRGVALTPVQLQDVFGVSRDVPLTYVERESVDYLLKDSLSRGKHIVVFGSSKQGKTCLRKHNLDEDKCVVINCLNTWELSQLHSAILKAAGYMVAQSTTKTSNGSNKVSATASAGANFGFVKANTEVAGEVAKGSSIETVELNLELDPEDANEIVSALKQLSFQKHIVLEDFHYLSEKTQSECAIALKIFADKSNLCFIIVGVWIDEDRLIELNGDLAGRVAPINADTWTHEELRQLVAHGADLLNVQISEEFTSELLENSDRSVYIVQETCYRLCKSANVLMTQKNAKSIGVKGDAREIARKVVEESSARYRGFLTYVASGFRVTELEMYRWIAAMIVFADRKTLEDGMTWEESARAMRELHPLGKGLNLGNVAQAFRSVASLQVKRNLRPIVLDYDNTRRRLNVVDRGFLLWRDYQNEDSMLDAIGLVKTTEESLEISTDFVAEPTEVDDDGKK